MAPEALPTRFENRALRAAALGALASCCNILLLWGFTVDDAWISARVAQHLHHGLGYRFNAQGAVVDAVTPLGWAHLLAPFAETTVSAVEVARHLGAVFGVLAGALLGLRLHALGGPLRRLAPLLVLVVSAPLGAWAVSGMETSLVILLCTAALWRRWWGTAAGLVACFLRPELLPFVFTLQLGWALVERAPALRVLLMATLPWFSVALAAGLRLQLFGQAAPLGFLAKPGDLSQGIFYVVAGCWLTAAPWLLTHWRGWRSVPASLRVVAAAVLVHWLVIAAVGGDWMPFFRLLTPVLPAVLLLGGALVARGWPTLVRFALALLSAALLLATHLSPARGVFAHRLALTRQLATLVTSEDRIATLDVGWVGAASEATVIDLAGVTDPGIARLPGGHTSKRLPEDFLQRYRPNVLVLLTSDPPANAPSWQHEHYARVVEQRVALLADHEQLQALSVSSLSLGGTAQRYVVVRLSPVH